MAENPIQYGGKACVQRQNKQFQNSAALYRIDGGKKISDFCFIFLQMLACARLKSQYITQILSRTNCATD